MTHVGLVTVSDLADTPVIGVQDGPACYSPSEGFPNHSFD